MLVNFLL